jgi:hypothetical protein
MADAAGRISALVVRCPCSKSFENVETYLRHKRLCGIHQKKENIISTAPSSNQRTATVPAKASPPKPVARWCGRMFKNHHALQKHGCHCAVHKQQTNAHSASSDSAQVLELYSGAGSVSAAEERPIPSAEAPAMKIYCPCGRSFANEKALNQHLRCSKTHQAGKLTSASKFEATTPGLVPYTTPHPSPTLISPCSGPVPGTVSSSALSLAPLFPCTCGHAFQTQQVLNLHKRDSLYHKQQADQSLTRKEKWDDSLVSSFAFLNLEPVLTQAKPSVARFDCMCGLMFTNEKALEQHKRDARRFAWQEKVERRETIFKTPRPQYREDEYLRDLAAALAYRYCSRVSAHSVSLRREGRYSSNA